MFKKYTFFYLIAFLSEVYFIIPVWLFFYQQFISYEQIVYITVAQTITSVIAEIPTGAFADMFGRKASQLVGYCLYILSLSAIVVSTQFWIFFVFEIVKGIAKAFLSGSFEALAYDSLRENGDEEHYDEFVSTCESLSWIGLFVSTITGGFLFAVNYRLPHLLVIVTYVVVIALYIFKIKEPQLMTSHLGITMNEYMAQNLRGFKEIFKSRQVAMVMLFFALITLGYYFASELLGISQAREYGLQASGVGILFASGYIISAIASRFYPKIRKVVGTHLLLVVCSVMLISSLLLATWVPVVAGIILIFLRIASSTTFRNTRSILLNKELSSRNRATALSSFNIVYLLPYAIISLLAGSYIDKAGPNAFAWILGLGIILLLAIIGVVWFTAPRHAQSHSTT